MKRNPPYLRYLVKNDNGSEQSFTKKREAIELAQKVKGVVLDLMADTWHGAKMVASFKEY